MLTLIEGLRTLQRAYASSSFWIHLDSLRLDNSWRKDGDIILFYQFCKTGVFSPSSKPSESSHNVTNGIPKESKVMSSFLKRELDKILYKRGGTEKDQVPVGWKNMIISNIELVCGIYISSLPFNWVGS